MSSVKDLFNNSEELAKVALDKLLKEDFYSIAIFHQHSTFKVLVDDKESPIIDQLEISDLDFFIASLEVLLGIDESEKRVDQVSTMEISGEKLKVCSAVWYGGKILLIRKDITTR
jgi:hypothetical protein